MFKAHVPLLKLCNLRCINVARDANISKTRQHRTLFKLISYKNTLFHHKNYIEHLLTGRLWARMWVFASLACYS